MLATNVTCTRKDQSYNNGQAVIIVRLIVASTVYMEEKLDASN